MLEAGFEDIRDEVLALVDGRPEALKPNFTPGGFRSESWRTINLCAHRLRYHRNRAKLPRTAAICETLSGLAMVQVSVLGPGVDLDAHNGDTNLYYRLHLPLEVVGEPPELGLEVGGEAAGWELGKAVVFEDAHLHRAWNQGTSRRIVLVVDVAKEEVLDRIDWLAAQAGIGVFVQWALARLPVLWRLPPGVRRAVLAVGGVPVWLALPLQRRLGRRPVVPEPATAEPAAPGA